MTSWASSTGDPKGLVWECLQKRFWDEFQPSQGTSGSAGESLMDAGKHQEPPLTLSTTCSQCWAAAIQLFGQRTPGSDQLQGAVPLHLQVRDAARHHLLPSPAVPKGDGCLWGPWLWQEQCWGAALLSSLRSDMVSVLGSYYYDDGCEACGNDTFSREPFIVKFSSSTTREQSQCWQTWHGVPSTQG